MLQTYQMISHSLVSSQSYIQPPSRGPFQSGFSGVAMKETRRKMSPSLKLVPPIEHHRAWAHNQEGTFVMAKLSLLEKKKKNVGVSENRELLQTYMSGKVKSAYDRAKWPTRPSLYSGFTTIKQPGVFLTLPWMGC